ncbi:hypothetical protein LC55x_5498 [Lysobacter capsici]|nr:hypothetical protein LC55x_5498 [Lysobacter capsici]
MAIERGYDHADRQSLIQARGMLAARVEQANQAAAKAA